MEGNEPVDQQNHLGNSTEGVETANVSASDPPSVDQLSALFTSGMPRVEEYITKAPGKTEENPNGADFTHLVDDFGQCFNPERHETDEAGNPLKTRNGNWRRKPGRKRLEESQIRIPGSPPPENAEGKPTRSQIADEKQKAADKAAMRQTCAAVTVECIETVTVGIFGEHFKLGKMESGIEEKPYLVGCFDGYLATKPDMDIPPGLVLVLGIGMVYAPRFRKKETLTVLQRIQVWGLKKWWQFKNRKNPQEMPPENPQVYPPPFVNDEGIKY